VSRVIAFSAAIGALLLCAPHVRAQVEEDDLVRNPGFELPAADNPYAGWVFVNHGQDFIRGGIQALDYHSGLKAAAIAVSQKPRVYACWAQHVPVKDDAALPDEVALWYRAANSACQVVMSFSAIEDGKGIPKGGLAFTLEQSRDWRRSTQTLDVPSGTRDILLELRVSQEGEYRFDDVSLRRTEKEDFTGKPDRLLLVGVSREGLPELWREALPKAGWEKLSFETWDNLSPNLLKKCRVVALIGLPPRSELSEADEAIGDLLVDYVKAGGGVLLTQNSQQCVTGMTLYFRLAERFGTRILFEQTTSDPALTKHLGSWGPDTFTFADKVAAPVAEGIRGVMYQSYVDMGSYAGVLPFPAGDPWQVVLSAGPNSKTEPYLLGLEEVDSLARTAGFASDVALAGLRESGEGRVAYVGMNPTVVFTRAISSDEDRRTFETYMVKGVEDRPSDLLRFYTNVFAWLGAKADGLAGASLALRKVPPIAYTTTWKLHRGIIGPRTSYSSGASTPDEYATKAREAGLDFVIFLEEFAALKPDGFGKLKQDCRRLSDGAFLAVPGLTYENTDGNHELAFGSYLKLPSRKLLDESGQRFRVYPDTPARSPVNTDQTWLYQLLGFENSSGWYLFSRNPYPHFDTRDVNCMGVITQEDGKTLERALEAYGQEERNEQYLWPLALTLMKSAGEMAQVRSGAYYHLIVGADGTDQLRKLFNTYDCRCAKHLFPPAPPHGHTSVTNGPVIELAMPRGDTDPQGDIFSPNLQEWQVDLQVKSDVGLREVVIMDGDMLIRRFLPGGAKDFAYQTSLARERQKHIWVHATDVGGKEAIGRSIHCDSWLLREWQCMDRNNQLLYSQQLRPDGTPFYVGYGGDTATPDKGPWNCRIRPVGCFVFDKKLGAGAMAYDGSPENHPQLGFTPFLVFDGKRPEQVGWGRRLVADREGAPHVRPRRVVSCSDVLVGDHILDGVFPLEADPVIHVWHSIYPVKPSRYLKTTARVSFYLPKVDGITAYLWDQSFELLRDLPVSQDSPYAIGLGMIAGWLGSGDKSEHVIVHRGEVAERAPLKAQPVRTFPFDRGDYIGILGNVFGSLFVYSLSDDLVLEGDGINYGLGIKAPAGTLPTGTQRRARLLLVGMHRLVDDPVKLAAQVARDYGLAGAPSYTVEAEQGTVVSQEYVLQLDGSHGSCFRGRLRGLNGLAGNLGCMARGLNDNWSAFLQVQDLEHKTRLVPVEEGTAYAVLRADEDGRRLFIGHPLVADNPNVIISIARTRDWKAWQAEIHNPTDQPLTVTVRANPHVSGLRFAETLTLPPGSSTFRNLGPADSH